MENKIKAGKLHISRNEKFINTVDIFLGKNVIGRTSQEKKSNIQISGDEYLSKQHFVIEVAQKKNGSLQYIIYEEKQSVNGTKIIEKKKEKKLSVLEKIIITNECKIIAGTTSFSLEERKIELPQNSTTEENTEDKTILV